MLNKLRMAMALAMAILVVAVDFSSKLLSIAADGLLIGVCIVVLWPVIKAVKVDKKDPE